MAGNEDNSANPESSFSRRWIIAISVGFMVAVALFLALPSGESEAPMATPVSNEPRIVVPSVASEITPAFSEEALQDLQADPNAALTIDPQPLLLELLPEEIAEVAGDETPAVEPAEPETPEPPEEPFSVGEALARYLLAIRNDLSSEYVANCIRFRNRNGAGADCPAEPAFTAGSYQQERALVDDLFAIITRQAEYARISSRLQSENATLAAQLEDPDSPAALQASTKIALNNAYIAYLNGNPSPDVSAFSTMNDFVNDYNRTILVGPVQFRCQGGPCVYEYNGPGSEQPE